MSQLLQSPSVRVLILCLLAAVPEPAVGGRISHARATYQGRQVDVFVPLDVAAVTPYPSADELKPEVPFDEGVTDSRTPLLSYGPPDDTTFSIPEPDSVYGPPEVIQNDLLIPNGSGAGEDAASASFEPAAEPFPPLLGDNTARLVATRRTAGRRGLLRATAAAVRVVRSRSNIAAAPIKYRIVRRAGKR